MVSISSAKKIKERTFKFLNENYQRLHGITSEKALKSIENRIKEEYNLIPEKERVGKGLIYISRYTAKATYKYLSTKINLNDSELLSLIENSLEYVKIHHSREIYHFAMLFLSEFLNDYPDDLFELIKVIKEWADHDDWEFRESVIFPLMAVLKKNSSLIIPLLLEWIKDDKEYIRRLVVESLRPKVEIKWLRDPLKNDEVLKILTSLNQDPSIYVRKAVGNNLKDLTKYMPEKILDLMEGWIKKSGIQVHKKLAMEVGLNEEQKRLIWTMKQALRWVKDRIPEYHDRVEKLLGSYYLLYFDEKSNRLAKPT